MKTIVVHTQAREMAAHLQQIRGGIEITGAYENGEQGIEAICAQLPDLAVLDIDLAGIGALSGLRQHEHPFVEFVLLSEWATFAYEAFQFGATDFLLKPAQNTELLQALDRAAKKVNDKILLQNAYPLISNLFPRLRDNRIVVQTDNVIDYIPVWHIVRCEDETAGCRIVLKDKRSIALPGGFADIQQELKQYPFLRVNDHCVVNLQHVAQYKRGENHVILNDGAEIEVSAPLRAEVLRRLGQG